MLPAAVKLHNIKTELTTKFGKKFTAVLDLISIVLGTEGGKV